MTEKAHQERQRKRSDALAQPEFETFLTRGSLIMERALAINKDIFMERAAGVYDTDEVLRHSKEVLHEEGYFYDDALTRTRTVTALSFQPMKGSEFFIASYRELNTAFGQGANDSMILGWSVHVKRAPAFKLTAPLDVTQAQYCTFRSNIVIGGSYSGQVILWDTRKGETPVMVTPVMKETHTNPVFGINMLGTASSHQLVTVSNDGKMCTWNLEKMNAPVEKSSLQVKEEVGDTAISKPISCTSVDFSQHDSEKFFVGGESGTMYSASRHSQNLNKIEAHHCPVTSVHCHPLTSADDAGIGNGLVVSSSLDWTCRLWGEDRSNLLPLHTFNDYTEYVYDVKWSPTHPSMFASGDGNGVVTLWNLSRVWNVPMARFSVGHDDAVSKSAVNRLSWSMEGKFLAAGDTNGAVTLLEVSSDPYPTVEEVERLRQNIASAQNTAQRLARGY